MADLARTIAAAGLRVTPQRLLLLELLLREGGHLTADDLYRLARLARPGLSATSIYKSLHALRRTGLVREAHVGAGPLRYDAGLAPRHHHRVCRACGRVDDVPCRAEPADSCIARHDLDGFAIEEIEVTYRGRCAACPPVPDARRPKENV